MKTVINLKTLLSFLLLTLVVIGVSKAQTNEVVVMDTSFPNSGGLIASLPLNVELIEANSSSSLAHTLKEVLAANPSVTIIHLFAPSNGTSMDFGERSYTVEDISREFNPADYQTDHAITVFVYSCSLAKNPIGISFLKMMSSKTGFNVASFSTCNNLNEEFNFDYSVKPLTFNSNLFE